MAGGNLAALATPLDSTGRLVDSALTPAMVDLLGADPGSVLERLEIPVLALWGALDLQVDGPSNEEALRRALERAGNRDLQLEILPGLDHFLLPPTDGLAPAQEPAVAYGEGVVDLVVSWIGERFVEVPSTGEAVP
jgi:hypothetical protein